MNGKEAVIKVIAVMAAAVLFAAGLVVFYIRNEKESEEGTSRVPIDTGSYTVTAAAKESALPSESERVYPIDINKATADDLTSVNGIGEVTAGRILDYRAGVGVIHDIAELSSVEGIGDELCGLIAEYFFVDEKDFVKYTTTATTVESHKRTTRKTTTAASKTTTTAATTKHADFPLDINCVTRDELMQIDGIGEGLADKILALRTAKGKITDMQQLLEIHGIGQATLDMLCAYLYVDKADYSAVTTTTTTTATATTAATSKTAKSTSGSSHTTTVQSTTQKQKRRVNINKADAAEIADALLIDDEAAGMIVWLREKIHGYSNILEVLYLEDFDKRYDTEFYNSIKDYIYIE